MLYTNCKMLCLALYLLTSQLYIQTMCTLSYYVNRVGDSLGSGQFGVVNQGRWLAAGGGRGPVEVAIKTLRPESREEDKVKFLQEAAINGQFRHPNIVRLHGVVTVGEPVSGDGPLPHPPSSWSHVQVMIVLEFLPNGDLREFLNSLKSQ